jgi:hypothetical protein
MSGWFSGDGKSGWFNGGDGGWKGVGNTKADKFIGAGMAAGIAGVAAWWALEKWLGGGAVEAAPGKVVGAPLSNWALYGSSILGALGLVTVGAAYGYKRYLDGRGPDDIQYVRLFPVKEYRFNGELIEQFVASLHQAKRPQLQRFKKGNEWFQLYFVCKPSEEQENGVIQAYFGYPKDRQGFIKEKLRQTFRGFDMKEVPWWEVPILVGTKGVGGIIQPEAKELAGAPFKGFDGEIMGRLLSHLRPNSAFAVSVHPVNKRRMTQAVAKTKKYMYKEMGFDPKTHRESQLPDDIQWQLNEMRDRQHKGFRPFDVRVAVWQTQEAFGDIVYSLMNELNAQLAKRNQALRLKETKRNPIQIVPQSYFPHWEAMKKLPIVSLNNSFLMSEKELANLLHFPAGMKDKDDMHHIYRRMEAVSKLEAGIKRSEFTAGIYIGKSLSPAQDFREMYLIEEVLRKMAVLVGRTGSGKTALIHGMVRHLIEKRLHVKTGGLTILDPKMEFAYAILTFLNRLKVKGLLTEEVENIFEFYDITSDEYTFGLNPMEKRGKMTEQDKHEMARAVIGVLKAAYPSESILAEKFGELAVKCLLEDPEIEHTIVGIADFIDAESPLRDRLYMFLKSGNPYQQRLAKQIERLKKDFGGTDTKPLMNRLHRLAENPLTRKIFGLKKTTINPLEIMEKGKIVMFNTKGLEPEEIRLVLGYILNEYHVAANQRTNTAETHFLIIDEAHEVQPPILHQKILPKDRAFGLSLILMTQFLDQFKEELMLAVTENVGTIMSAAVGKKSAKLIEDITTGRAKKEDVQNFKSLTALIDTEDSKGERATFMVKAEPPYVYGADGEPTFYSKDDPRRTDREKNEAFRHAWETLGRKWMARDGRPIEEAEKELEAYALLLSGETMEEQPQNVVDMKKKKKKPQSFDFSDLEQLAATREEME